MASGVETGPLHPVPTRRSGYRYFFYVKHHGRGGAGDAQWSDDLSPQEEFGVFDLADEHDLSDQQGNLFGLHIGRAGKILMLGTWKQQVAKFPRAHPGQPWHGYPLWPVEDGPSQRRGHELRPQDVVFF
jgi:hypothetical protein